MKAGRPKALAAVGLAVGLLVVSACGGDGGPAAPAAPATTSAPTTGADTSAGPATGGGELAQAIRPLPAAPAVPAAPEALPAPMALTVDDLGIESSPVVPVGVDPDGDMEVPGAREVGWYRFGSRPGDEGSAVLAAHVAYDGVDGVFRNLGDLAAGATFDWDQGDLYLGGDALIDNAGTFAASFCDQAWRWNLDYVIDVHGNTMSLWWARETNHYARNMAISDPQPYHRAGHLLRIDYGSDNRGGTEYSGTAPYVKNTPARVEFTPADRCLSNCGTKNATTWPDTPWELECTANSTQCLNGSPTFWGAKRLSVVTTKVWRATTSSRSTRSRAPRSTEKPVSGSMPASTVASRT